MKAALIKAKDMLMHDYFSHTSPDGNKSGELVTAAGYAYRMVGENIAYGDYTDSAQLVGSWMKSPGHRANILEQRYTDIGVAVLFGEFNGRNVWVGVQIFGRPMSEKL